MEAWKAGRKDRSATISHMFGQAWRVTLVHLPDGDEPFVPIVGRGDTPEAAVDAALEKWRKSMTPIDRLKAWADADEEVRGWEITYYPEPQVFYVSLYNRSEDAEHPWDEISCGHSDTLEEATNDAFDQLPK